jgi:2-methylcitrate dehydratase
MEAPNLPFVGKAGWCSQVAREAFQLDRLMPSSRPRKILDTRIKHRPAAGETISSIIAAEKIAKACRTPDEITAIRVDLYKRALVRAATGDHHWHPESRDAAANSIPYLVATTILDGTISLHSFSDEKISWPRTQDLLSKITVHEDGVFTKAYNKTPVGHWTRITVRMKDGSVLKAETGDDEDDLSAPRTDAQIDAKFRQLAGSRLQVSALERALSTLWDLDTCSNIAPILEMLRMDHDQPARPDAIPTPGGAQR